MQDVSQSGQRLKLLCSVFGGTGLALSGFQVAFVAPEVAKVDVAVVAEKHPKTTYAYYVMLLALNETMGHLHEQTRLQLSVFRVAGVQVECTILVERVYLSHDHIALLHYFAHVKLVLLIFLALLRDVSGAEGKVSVGRGLYVNFPPLVGDLYGSKSTSVMTPTTISPI